MDRDVVANDDFPSNKSIKGEYDSLFLDESDIMHRITSPKKKNLTVVFTYDIIYGGSYGGVEKSGLGRRCLF